MKKFFYFLMAVLFMLSLVGCGSSSSKYSGYSDTYKSSSSYRKNVDEVAGIYGISSKEADAKINAVADYFNGK